jgi:hypothetical protein
MPSPFPGIDPFLEAQGRWPGFHTALMTHCSEVLNRDLPDSYVAQIDERISLVSYDDPASDRIPDVLVMRSEEIGPAEGPASSQAIGVLEPATMRLVKRQVEVRESWVEIYHLPEMELVTVLEILSPSNKSGTGRADYLAKRDAMIDRPVNLVEIDLLSSGRRLPMQPHLLAGVYYAIIARPEHRPDAQVYSWTLRDRLPRLPIPLLLPDPDVMLDLAETYQMAYDRGGYRRIMRYGGPLPASLPVSPEDRTWAESLAR